MKAPIPTRKRVLVLTAGLDCPDRTVNALRARYQVSSVTELAELPKVLGKLTKPHAVVMAAELRSQLRNTGGPAMGRLLERVFSGKASMPVILLAKTRESQVGLSNRAWAAYGAITRSNPRFLSFPFEDHELFEAIELGLARKKYKRLAAVRMAAAPILVFLAFLAAWEGACHVFSIREFVLPPQLRFLPSLLRMQDRCCLTRD